MVLGLHHQRKLKSIEMQGMVRIGGDVIGIDDEIITALTNTQDLIGAVLRIHFCLEGVFKYLVQ